MSDKDEVYMSYEEFCTACKKDLTRCGKKCKPGHDACFTRCRVLEHAKCESICNSKEK